MAQIASTHVPSPSKWCRGTCRCEACHEARKLYCRQWKALQRIEAGAEPASRVPTFAVKMHLQRLERAGMSRRAIARSAGVSPAVVTRLSKPTTKRASSITVRLILAVEP